MRDPADLLPTSATALEAAMSEADASQLAAPTEIIRTVLDPTRSPAVLLPWLALQHRVTHTWTSGLTVAQQRQVIAAQYGILQHAGTPKGLGDALAQLGLEAGYDEWFEYGGDPYFIRLRVGIVGTVPWTAALDAQVWQTTIAYKNRRTAIGDFALVRTIPEGGPVMAAVQFIDEVIAFELVAPDIDPPAAEPVLAAVVLIVETLVFGAAA